MRTVVALFDQRHSPEQALAALSSIGIERGQVSLIGSDHAIHQVARLRGSIRGAILGVFVGGAIGALIGLAFAMLALARSGPTPIVEIGPLTTYFGVPTMIIGAALAWAGLGAGLGSVAGALLGETREERRALAYADGVARGETMMAVRAENTHAAAVAEELRRAGAEAVETHRGDWAGGDWRAFDVNGPPLRHPARV